MRELIAILDQQLSQLESERGSIEDGIQEINRRITVLNEVEGWELLAEPDDAVDYTATDRVEIDSKKSIEGVKEPAYSAQ